MATQSQETKTCQIQTEPRSGNVKLESQDQWTLCRNCIFPNEKIKQKRVAIYPMCVLLTLPAPNPGNPVKSDLESAKQIKISAKTNSEHIMKSSLRTCAIKASLNEKQLCSQNASNLCQLLQGLHIRALYTFTRSMRLKYMFTNSKSNPHPFDVKCSWQPPPQPVAHPQNPWVSFDFRWCLKKLNAARKILCAQTWWQVFWSAT